MALPKIPLDVLHLIIDVVAKRNFLELGPFIRAGKEGYNLAHTASVLRKCNLDAVCIDTNNICPLGKYRAFFEKCLAQGSTQAIFLEGLRLATKARDLPSAINLLLQNVPQHEVSTLAVACFSICLGDATTGSQAFQIYEHLHADLRSEVFLQQSEELFIKLAWFDPPYEDTYEHTFSFPDDDHISLPICGYYHEPGGSDGRRCNCDLFWFARDVSKML